LLASALGAGVHETEAPLRLAPFARSLDERLVDLQRLAEVSDGAVFLDNAEQLRSRLASTARAKLRSVFHAGSAEPEVLEFRDDSAKSGRVFDAYSSLHAEFCER
jgi:hypothetical protein